MSRLIFALFFVSLIAGAATAQESFVCEGECQGIGVEFEEYRISVSEHGSTCDTWTFNIGPVELNSTSDLCPAILRYRPECAKQVPKERHCIKRAWSDKVTVYYPQCICVTAAIICLDWECRLGPPQAMEDIHCFGEAVCPKKPEKH
ncbi:MAG: hypothetical protein RL885_14225 [Planctomycetota bacterium]